MAAKLLKLPTHLTVSQEQTVAELEMLLVRAKNGDFDGFAWCASLQTGGTATSWTAAVEWTRLLAGVVTLQWRMLEQRTKGLT